MIYGLLLIISWVYIAFGIIGIFRFSNVYARLLTSSSIDTVAAITILISLIFKVGINAMSIRLIIILVFIIITGPISAHTIVRSAYLNGIQGREEESENDFH